MRKTKAKRSFCTGWVRCLFVLLRRWGWWMDFDHWSIYSSWLKAKGICLLWTISRAADTSVLGRLEGDLWENYPIYHVRSIDFVPDHYGEYSSHFISRQIEVWKVHCMYKFTYLTRMAGPGFKSKSPPPPKACGLSTLPQLLIGQSSRDRGVSTVLPMSPGDIRIKIEFHCVHSPG